MVYDQEDCIRPSKHLDDWLIVYHTGCWLERGGHVRFNRDISSVNNV